MRSDRRVRAAAALLGLVMLSGWSCARQAELPVVTTAARTAAAESVVDASVYDLDLPLVDADGHASALSDLRGRIVVATMMYTSCATVCPRVTEDLKTIERRLPDGERPGVVFALFSLDPVRDTPDALRRFAARHALDRAHWRLFAASPGDVRSLAAALGVKYAPTGSGEIAHAAPIVVIDRGGVVRHRQTGLVDGWDDVMQSIAVIGADESRGDDE